MDQPTGGKWLIYDTKRYMDHQLQNQKTPADFLSLVMIFDTLVVHGTTPNPLFKREIRVQRHLRLDARIVAKQMLSKEYLLASTLLPIHDIQDWTSHIPHPNPQPQK